MVPEPTNHFVLVPGFFGFTNLGELPYFAHVEPVLERAAAARGLSARVSVVSTDPTASLPYRAARVAEHLTRLGEEDGGQFHIIGHSTGGLDARLMVTPAVSLPTNADVEAVAQRVRSVVCISTPHRGTPLVSFFAGRFAQSLLQIFSLVSLTILRRGRVPVMTLLRLASMLERLRAGRRLNPSAVARLHDQLLADYSPERQAQLEAFLKQVHVDQGLLPQLTPDGLEVFNASTPDRPGVRYGCVAAWGRPPGVASALKAGLDPYAQATHALYTAIHRLSGAMPGRRAEVRAPGQDGLLGAAYGVVPGWDATDGIVPTRSQVWGELLHATVADHLDVVGYFNDPEGDPPHFDWLASASGFNRERFEALWADIAHFVIDTASNRLPPSAGATLLPGRTRGQWPDDVVSEALKNGDDRLVSPAAHRRWVLGRIAVWLFALACGANVHLFFAGWQAATLTALAVAGLGEGLYRRWMTVPTVEGPARNLSTLPPRYLVWSTGRVVRLTSAPVKTSADADSESPREPPLDPSAGC